MEITTTPLFLSNPDTHTATLSPVQVGHKSHPSTLFAGMVKLFLFKLLCSYPFPPLLPSLALKNNCPLSVNRQASSLPSLLPFRSSFLLPLPIILHLLHFAMTVSYHRGAVCDGLASLLCGGRFASVSVVVEVGEEDDEGDSIANQSPLHPGREWTACVEGVASMADGHVELDLLNRMYTHNKIILPETQ